MTSSDELVYLAQRSGLYSNLAIPLHALWVFRARASQGATLLGKEEGLER